MVSSNKLRQEIIAFRKKLDDLNGKALYWDHTPVLNFKDKEKYPKDFQIFMEEIGQAHAGSGPLQGDGFLILELEAPIWLPSAVEAEEFIYLYDFIETEILEVRQLSGLNKKISGTSINAVASDCHANFYGFDTTTNPYSFISYPDGIWSGSGDSFFEWFQDHMIMWVDDLKKE
jgi:hypothetical protein